MSKDRPASLQGVWALPGTKVDGVPIKVVRGRDRGRSTRPGGQLA